VPKDLLDSYPSHKAAGLGALDRRFRRESWCWHIYTNAQPGRTGVYFNLDNNIPPARPVAAIATSCSPFQAPVCRGLSLLK